MSKTLRSTRAEFTKKYEYSKVVRMLAKGKNTQAIAKTLGLPMRVVSTVKGNCTRGCYLPYVQVKNGEVTGTCNY